MNSLLATSTAQFSSGLLTGISRESQNVYQILDNVSKIWGNHSLKFGVSFQAIRFYYIYAPADLGQYHWMGQFTGLVGVANTGSAVADMLVDQETTQPFQSRPT